MFAPKFQITNKMLANLINIEVDSKLMDVASLQPDWESRLRSENLAKRAYGIFHYLENGLGVDDISKIVKDEPGRDDKPADVALRVGVVGKERDVQQILNFLNANKLATQIAYLTAKFKQTDYGLKDLININSLLGERMVRTEELGIYRKKDAEGQIKMMPLVAEVSFQTEDLFGWFGSVGSTEINPVLKAGVMLFELLRISPFANNSLVSALLFAHIILCCEGYQAKQLWSFEEELLKNTSSYQLAIESVARNGGDLTIWLEFFTRAVSEAIDKVKIKVFNLVGGAPIFKSEGGRVISLSERQIAIMEEITVRNEMTIKEVRGILPMVSDDTILRDIKDLMDKKLIRKKGKTKGATYVIGKVKSYR